MSEALRNSRTPWRSVVLFFLIISAAWLGGPLQAHHFKGLPHYNYFENYPQVPEEEFIGRIGDYEMSLVVYDFQGINRERVEAPDNVRLYLVIFNLRDNRVYQGKLGMEILDGEKVHDFETFESAELENLYSIHRELPQEGRYALRLTLEDEGGVQATIPFRLSSQKVRWERWIAGGLVVLISVTALGARRKRVQLDRLAARRRKREVVAIHE